MRRFGADSPREHPLFMKKHALLVAKVLVSILLLAYLLSTTNLRALAERVRGGDSLLLFGSMVVYVVIIGLSIWRWQMLLHAQGFSAPLARLSSSYLVATFFNNFLPSN